MAYLHVDPSNEAATSLYARAGYVPVPSNARDNANGSPKLLGGLLEFVEPQVTYMYKKL